MSPNSSGRIFFFDKKNKIFFKVFTREIIDSNTADHIFTYNDYDLSFLRRYDELIEIYNGLVSSNKTPLIIDCGANIGFSAYYFAKEFPKSSIVTVEPEAKNCSMIKKNCKGLSNVTSLNCAIGSSDGFVAIENSEGDNNAFRTSRTDDKENGIEVISIEKILSDNPNSVPFIVKIDIEGFEDDLFSANTDWVGRFPLLIIETHDWMLPKQANSKNLLKVISRQNRDFVHKGENIFSISNDVELH